MQTLAVIGPNAADVHLGGYSEDPGRGTSILQGIKNKAGTVKVVFAEGCRITEGPADWNRNEVTPADPAKNAQRIAEAVAIARTADAIVAVIGTNESTSREAWADNHLGDMAEPRPDQSTGRTGPSARGNRETGHDRARERPARRHHQCHQRREGRPRSVVSGAGRGNRGRGSALRRRQSRRQAADQRSAERRPAARVLQSEADVVQELSLRIARTALPIRVRPQLHNLPPRRSEARGSGNRSRRTYDHERPGDQYRNACTATRSCRCTSTTSSRRSRAR